VGWLRATTTALCRRDDGGLGLRGRPGTIWHGEFVVSRFGRIAATSANWPLDGNSDRVDRSVCCTCGPMTKRRKVPRGTARLVEAARRNEQSAPRKHHLVPASYLRRWAENDVIRVTDINAKRTYVTSPEKAARETDFYRLEAAELDPDELPPLLFETLLATVEGWGNSAIDHLLSLPQYPDPQAAANLASFLGFQFTRGVSHRESILHMANEGFKLRYRGVSDDWIRHELRRRTGTEPTNELVASSRQLLDEIQDGTVHVGPQVAALVGLAGESAITVGGHFLNRAWVVCRTGSRLVTCDEPVVLIGGPRSRRSERAGIATAGVIVFPLDPAHLLAMFRADIAFRLGLDGWRNGQLYSDDLDYVEVAELCREVVGNANRWAFEQPSKQRALGFPIPPAPEPTSLEEAGAIDDEGTEKRLIRVYRATRWRNAPVSPPWPVERWWS
jgi:Protein of unknown function (DUF4238)